MLYLFDALFSLGMWLHRNGRMIAIWSFRQRMKHKKRKLATRRWVTTPAVDLQ
jgi:hypothetical protein